MSDRWTLTHHHGRAGDLHAGSAAALDDPGAGRLVRVLTADRPALVLGSHQPVGEFDPGAVERAGLELARRRSGGGAVVVGPGEVLWLDFVIGRDDPLWDDDVGRAAWWVGDLWMRALAATGVAGGCVWRGALQANRWSPIICFAGLGPGEVTVGGAKVVGVSQRRTPRAALFQTAVLLAWRPESYLGLMAGEAPAGGVPPELRAAAAGIGPARSDELLSALAGVLVQ